MCDESGALLTYQYCVVLSSSVIAEEREKRENVKSVINIWLIIAIKCLSVPAWSVPPSASQ